MKRTYTLVACCALLVFLFMYASVSKLTDFPQYVYDMHNQIFPDWITDILIPAVPASEILISIALYIDRTRKAGLVASLVLMLLFSLYTFLVLIHTFLRVPCSCGGIIRKLSWMQHLFLNLFFVGVTILGLYLHRKIKQSAGYPALT